MPNSTSPAVSGPRKRKLSNKAINNGDPLDAQKRKKLLSAANTKNMTTALTKKRPSKTMTGTSKAASNQASGRVSEKDKGKHTPVENDDDMDDVDDLTNVNHNLEAANESDNSSNPVPIIILLDEDKTDNKANSEDDVEMNLEEAEESAEAELGRKNIFLLCI